MTHSLLHVISFVLGSEQDAQDALRHLRRLMLPGGSSMLLFADLPSAAGGQMPQDRPLIRMLQSGVMSMHEKASVPVFLLVRRRAWDDASRCFLGADQPLSCREVIAQLLAHGETSAVFEAATLAPAAFKRRYTAVLFSSLCLACTPDTPLRMSAALSRMPGGAAAASVLQPQTYPHTVLARAALCAPIDLSPVEAAKMHALGASGLAPASAPVIYTQEALIASLHRRSCAAPLAPDCRFIRRHPLTLCELFARQRSICMRAASAALIPPMQVLLFFLSAASGFPWLAALALLPEFWALVHPRQWPGALLRTALLPLTALISLDALLQRLLARSPLIRVRTPQGLRSPLGVMLAGAALLPLAIVSAHALTVLLPVCLLWLCAPVLLPALESPTIERIPLNTDEQAQIRTLAESAYWNAASDMQASASVRMLTSCAGCMLGILEPDEAARHVQALSEDAPASAIDHAARLVCAQYLREHMSDCDAALRDLPAQLEAGCANADLSGIAAQPLGAIFLALQPARATPQHPLTLPLTHPHTYLRQRSSPKDTEISASQPAGWFLVLAASALQHPFHALLSRSPVAAPYMLSLSAQPPRGQEKTQSRSSASDHSVSFRGPLEDR